MGGKRMDFTAAFYCPHSLANLTIQVLLLAASQIIESASSLLAKCQHPQQNCAMAKYLNSPKPKFYPCGVCGADVPAKALACPDCGADERTGLHGDEEVGAAIGLDDFSYDEFMKREFPSSIPRPAGLHWVWWVTGILLLLFLAWQATRT